MIAIVDYGMGNLRSVQKGFEKAGYLAEITDDPKVIARAPGVVLPGVGAFKDCFDGLVARGLDAPVKAAAQDGRPFLGICVGLQLLFEYGEEGAGSPGLGVLPGRVTRFPEAKATGLKVPHMGWNRLMPAAGRNLTLFDGISANPYAYFVHSYYAVPTDDAVVLAWCHYGIDFPAMVGRDNLFAVQFHPEKSQADGILMLRNFGKLTEQPAYCRR
ncbi:MAG TPA: imidazole glycerol phosphate synthase subunit HisH [Candidatus Hydrogenedentes bacterium]|nr:imidazole glycerol phosphate synthase subunit HisH [Candidatus Hydrogenedentota bacterium]